jgi:hypothetical protein
MVRRQLCSTHHTSGNARARHFAEHGDTNGSCLLRMQLAHVVNVNTKCTLSVLHYHHVHAVEYA